MKKDKIIKLLQILKAQNIVPAEEWVRCSCLFAHHKHASGKDNNPSSGISIQNHKSIYNCYSCGTSMPVDDAIFELFILNKAEGISNAHIAQARAFLEDENSEIFIHEDMEFEEEKKKEFYDFTDGWLNSFMPATAFPEAMEYLSKRKGGAVPLRVIKELDVRFDKSFRQMVGFPYREPKKNRVAGMRGRSIDPVINSDDTKKGQRHYDYPYAGHNNTSLVWYRASELNPKQPLIVVEGEFDAARVYQQYRNVTALLTANVSPDKMELLLGFPTILWMTDNDKAGIKSRERAREFFTSKKADFQDLFAPEDYKDVGETPAKYLKYILKEYVDIDEFIPSEDLTT